MAHAKMLEGEVPRSEYSQICKEVWTLVGVQGGLDMLGGLKPHHTPEILGDHLADLLEQAPSYHSAILSTWLRYSSSFVSHLQVWKDLRDVAFKQAAERNSPEFAQQLFVGMMNK